MNLFFFTELLLSNALQVPFMLGVCKSVFSIIIANANVTIESGDLSLDMFIPQFVVIRFVLDFLELQL